MPKFSKKNKIKIGVIFGGRSGEHEVSIVSAQSVIAAFDKNKYHVIPIGVTKKGNWIIKDPVNDLKKGAIKEKGQRLIPEKILNSCNVIFPLIHGSYGEDGTLQGMLEMANIAYIGGGVLASALSMDKVIQKQLTDQVGLPSVKYDWFFRRDWKKNKKIILARLNRGLKYPIFVKPANLGSSVGISKCHNQKELIKGISNAIKYDSKIITEQGIEEIHEIEVAILGNDKPQASVLGEIIPSNEFYDYDAKYVDGKSREIIPAKLPKTITKKIQEIAIKSFLTLNLSGMARIDFLVEKRSYKVYLNEINTIPGFTSISMYSKLWAASGLSYPKLLDKLVFLAFERYQEKESLFTSYQPKKDWYK